MTSSIEQIVAEHLSIWNSAESAERTNAIASTYSNSVLVGEAEAVYRGHEGVAQAIDAVQAALPGMQLELNGPVQTAQTMTTYSWALAPAGAPPVVTGRDVITVEGGVITKLYVFIDAPEQ